MIGQGRPTTSPERPRSAARTSAAALLGRAALALALVFASRGLSADEMRVRIAWGGGAERVWQGTISTSDGTLSQPRPLGVEADEPGSMWIEADAADGRTLVVQQRSPRGYDGVDVLVSASPGAKLIVQLTGGDDATQAAPVEVPLAELARDFVNRDLDAQGNRLLLMRAPGDALRVEIARDSLVFAPGETFRFTLAPHDLPLSDGGRARVKVQLLAGGGKELWSQEEVVQAGQKKKIPLEIRLPAEEGVYDIVIAAINNPNWSEAVRKPLNWRRSIAERRIQLVVVDRQRPAAPRAEAEFTQVVEIDPANPRWYEKLNKLPQLQLAKARLPRLWKGPLGNNCLQTRKHALGEVAQLAPNAESPDVSWEAYWLPIAQPGKPHILEIEYPSDVPQTLGVTVIEPNAAGAMMPLGLDAGVDNAAEPLASGESPCWLRHRLVFWPRTTTPLVLITNGRDRAPAVYGKIRVLAVGDRLPRALPDRASANRRLLAAYLDRPLLPESFAGDECLDPWSGRSLDDWWTFHEAGSRLVDYLHYAGCNGLMLGVLADGSTIYPSAIASPTPRYDTGVFFTTAQDPIRKDVLEMLLRMFDRENLQLIPMVEFASPLPELEAVRRQGSPEAHGLEWIGPEGTALTASSPAARGLAPYYNVLHPRVQQAMLGVLHEIVERYAQHPSLGGIAVRLSADGYAQLPGPDWGLDDVTIARFERDTKLRVPGHGPRRFAERAAFLAEEPRRRMWLEWRAAQLAKFYRRAYDELAAVRPESRLYLAGAGMIGGPELENDLRPGLPQRTNVAGALLRVGIDARCYQGDTQRIVLLRPEAVAPRRNLGTRAVDLELNQMGDFDTYFQSTATTGSLFFHRPREFGIPSFDEKCPFKPSYTWLVSQPTPSARENRRRFVHGLATLDAQAMIDGGWLPAMGEEEATRSLAAAYRALPAIGFQLVGGRQTVEAAPPVTFRSAVYGGRTFLYAVNDAPFAAVARVHIDAGPGCRIEELSGMRKIAPLRPDDAAGLDWEVELEPYDLVAVLLSEPSAQFSDPRVRWADGVDAALAARIHQLGARAAALRAPPPLDIVANPGFERSPGGDGPIPDWAVTSRSGVDIQLDPSQKHSGERSVRIASTGAVACLVSRPFAAPTTGRLSVSVWLRVADAARQPPLRLALEGKLRDRDYYRFAPVGQPVGQGQPTAPVAAQWGQYVFQVDDLPLDGLTSLRARFDLMGAGEVWVDDVQVFGLAFTRPELVELSKLIALANVKLQNRQIGDCLRLLDGYWPQFLEENVRLPAGAAMETATVKPRPDEEKPPERSGFLDRVKDMLPSALRF